jgi:hypothetical protein
VGHLSMQRARDAYRLASSLYDEGKKWRAIRLLGRAANAGHVKSMVALGIYGGVEMIRRRLQVDFAALETVMENAIMTGPVTLGNLRTVLIKVDAKASRTRAGQISCCSRRRFRRRRSRPARGRAGRA